MDAIDDLIAKYKSTSGEGLKCRLLDRLTDHLTDPRAFDFFLRVVEDDSKEEEVPRVAAIELMGWVPYNTEADKQRMIAALMGRVRRSPSSVERVYAVDALARFLGESEVRSLVHELLRNTADDEMVRSVALTSLAAAPPTEETVELCQRLLNEPALADGARVRLKRWNKL